MNTAAADIPAPESNARAACVLLIGVVMYLTLLPFGLGVPEAAGLLERLLTFDAATSMHVAPAFMIAMLLRIGWGLSPGRAAVVALVGFVSLEAAQVFIEGRHARAGDVVAQCVGLLLAGRLAPRAIGRRAWRAVWVLVLAAWAVCAASAGVRGQLGHTLGPMDASFRLVVGDEHGGGRAWLGEVHGLSIAAGARRSSAEVLVEIGPVPTGGEWVGSGATPVVLSRADGGWSSVKPVPGLCAALDEARVIRVDLDVTPALAEQFGPARIVSVSKGMMLRNLTLGQEGDALVCRVRTPRTGKNASSPAFVFPGVFAGGERARLTVWTDGGSAELSVDGRLTRRLESYVVPRDWLGLDPGLGDLVGPIALFAPIGLAAGMILAAGRASWIVAVGLPIAIVALIWGTAIVLHRPMSFWLLPASIVLSIGGVIVSAALGGADRGEGR